MTTTTELMFSDGNKVIEFKLTGYSEENSMKLVQDVLKSVTKSESAPKEKRCITIPAKQLKSLNNVQEPEKKPELGKVYECFVEPKKQQIQVEDKIEDTIEETSEEFSPEVVKSLFEDDNATFQAYYICKCGDRGKHFIKRSRIHVNCKKCGKRMRVRDASIHGFPYKDDYGNTYIAGEFRRSDEFKYGAAIF